MGLSSLVWQGCGTFWRVHWLMRKLFLLVVCWRGMRRMTVTGRTNSLRNIKTPSTSAPIPNTRIFRIRMVESWISIYLTEMTKWSEKWKCFICAIGWAIPWLIRLHPYPHFTWVYDIALWVRILLSFTGCVCTFIWWFATKSKRALLSGLTHPYAIITVSSIHRVANGCGTPSQCKTPERIFCSLLTVSVSPSMSR